MKHFLFWNQHIQSIQTYCPSSKEYVQHKIIFFTDGLMISLGRMYLSKSIDLGLRSQDFEILCLRSQDLKI